MGDRGGVHRWHDCARWDWYNSLTCPLSPLAYHVDTRVVEELTKRGRRKMEEKKRKEDEYDEPFKTGKKQLRYRVPTRAREEEFTRAAVRAAASVRASAGDGAKARKGQERGEEWLEHPALRPTGPPDFVTKGLLALALAAALIAGLEVLRRGGQGPSSRLVPRLEMRLSSGLQRQLQTRTPRRGGTGYQFNWAANLRTLLGGSTR